MKCGADSIKNMTQLVPRHCDDKNMALSGLLTKCTIKFHILPTNFRKRKRFFNQINKMKHVQWDLVRKLKHNTWTTKKILFY